MKIKIDNITWYYPKDLAHIRAYRDVIADRQYFDPDFTAPDWTELTEKQKANIRITNQEHWDAMHEFGKSLGKYKNDNT